MTYIHRKIESLVEDYRQTFSIVAITGPRQSGKSTLLRTLYEKEYRYVSFDDYRMVQFFHDDPTAFFNQYSDKVIFDEVQKVPLLFDSLKLAVDNDRETKGKFIITGSSQLSLHAGISESLAGRIGILALLPFQFDEIPEKLQYQSIFSGSYPEPVMMSYTRSALWYSSYLETFVMKDVKSLANIGDLHDFRQFIKLMAIQAAQQLNMSTLSRILGISVSTVKRWISVLEASYILFLLPPYHDNMGKRITKSPKVYFYDTGLLGMLTGVTSEDIYENGSMAGSIFENYLVSEIRKKQMHSGDNSPLYYYRTSNQLEIDLVREHAGYREWIEIKKSATLKPHLLKPLETMLSGADTGILLFNGDTFPYKENMRILNYKDYLRG